MNVKRLLACHALFFASASAFAQTQDYVSSDRNFVSGRTRAEVIAELQQAWVDGSLVIGGEEYPGQFPMQATMQRSRAAAIDAAQNKKAWSGASGG